jgi:hypothetical protein
MQGGAREGDIYSIEDVKEAAKSYSGETRREGGRWQ